MKIDVFQAATYGCDGTFRYLGNYVGFTCACDPPSQILENNPDGKITYNGCTGTTCLLALRQPEVCTADDDDNQAPFNEGCGDDEQSCSTLANDADGAPIRFSSGRVETNPLTFVEAPTPEGISFAYRLQWSSHREGIMAVPKDAQELQPIIHDHNETTYYIGRGWMDDFSDRLYIKTKTKYDDKIIWQRRQGSVTFIQVSGVWKSWGGKYELIDRGTNTWCDGLGYCDSYGRWVIRTIDTSAPRKIWAFEEYPYTSYAGTTPTYWLGRLTRHALLGTNTTNLGGTYGYTITWHSNGYISNVTDALNRQFSFAYVEDTSGSRVLRRALQSVTYKNASNASPLTISLVRAVDWRIDRINTSGGGVAAPSYVRFLYNRSVYAPLCQNCPLVVSDVIVPATASASTSIGALPLSTETVLEHNEYTAPAQGAPITDPGLRAIYSKYPGREYAYQFNPPANGVVTGAQFDLQQYTGQPAGTCVFPTNPGVCPAGSQCRFVDGKCYVANVFAHDSGTRLPVSKDFGSSSTSTSYSTGTAINGAPRSSVDAAGVKTSFGFDSLGRLRCRVVGDTDDEAFASPTLPDSSDCAGPANSQVVRVDYNGPCTGGHTLCTLKTTTSLLSGIVVEEEDLDPATRLPVRTKTTGQTRDVNGSLVTGETHISTRTYETISGVGRLLETNGPLDDAVALDKTTYTYWSTSDNDHGQLRYVTTYVGTSTSNTQLVTEYSSYDAWGIPRVVKQPNGDWVEYVTTDRLSWTIKQWSAANVLLGTSYVTLNPNGSVLKTIDADNVCMTYEHTTAGAVSRMRRSPNDGTCGALPVNVNSGEVEMRSYIAGDPDRLESVERRTNGVVELIYAGFSYDRDRRLKSADTMHSTSPFTFTFTDVLQTGVTAPEGPGPGTWRTEQTVDDFARPTGLLRFIDGTNKLTHAFGYSSSFSPRPTQLTRGYNGAETSVSTFEYDDFGRLLSATVPEAGTPGSPTTTRYEYDVAGRLSKKRSGIDTALVRTDVHTYDSLGRVLSVDNDTEKGTTASICASAPAGTPIQDVEYKYDTCDASDRPTGFTCNNALGRMTIARSILQCGTGGVVVKRGRWYDYTAGGQVSRVAYATVTGSTIGPPAIMDYSYSSAGRVLQYRSPINNIYGTKFTYSLGRVSRLDTTQSTPVLLADGITYNAFGPLATLTANVVQTSGSSTRKLKYESVHYNEGQLNQFKWRLVHFSGAFVSPISLVYQSLAYTPAGLIKDRYDFGDYEQSRYYGYDSLLRLTCEARGQSSTSSRPTSADCTQTSPRLAALVDLYGNGQTANSPPDVRLTSFVRGESDAEGASYASPSTETSTYNSGSSQVLGITRPSAPPFSTSSLVLGYDAVGRRTYDYDNFDATRSRRDYTYLPNGQLGSISGQTPNSVQYTTSVRYDESGRPLTINESLGDAYELFWDDVDRLIAVNITFNTPRTCAAYFWFGTGGKCSGIRWHYHYLDRKLIAATREMIAVVGDIAPAEPVLRLFAVTDERGLVHRLLDSSGATRWHGRWDASGTRTWASTPVGDLWVPFGLPGQVVLGKTTYVTGFQMYVGFLQATRSGTEAYASGSGGTWTRPPIALNRWRAYDPLMGAFLQPDPADPHGRLSPEGYAYGRHNSPNKFDPTGLATSWLDCDANEISTWQAALVGAYLDVAKCMKGECGLPGGYMIRRAWMNAILNIDKIYCSTFGEDNPDPIKASFDGSVDQGTAWAFTQPMDDGTLLSVLGTFYNPVHGCPKQIVAHEALHIANDVVGGVAAMPDDPGQYRRFMSDILGNLPHVWDNETSGEEAWVIETTRKCVDCTH